MINNTCKTAIKAAIYTAYKKEPSEKSGVKEIAKHIKASEHTVSKILQNLVHQNIINSIKGPNGGFYITENQRLQPILTIVDTIDGKDPFNTCGLGLAECSSDRHCPIHKDYKKARTLSRNCFQPRQLMNFVSL